MAQDLLNDAQKAKEEAAAQKKREKELEREDLSADLEKKLRQAVEDCHQILGEEHDAGRYLPADS